MRSVNCSSKLTKPKEVAIGTSNLTPSQAEVVASLYLQLAFEVEDRQSCETKPLVCI